MFLSKHNPTTFPDTFLCSFSIPGRPQSSALQPEADALQDALLSHASLQALAPASALEVRLQGAADIPARTLPLIAGPSPLDAWEAVLGREDAVEHPRWARPHFDQQGYAHARAYIGASAALATNGLVH